MKTYLRFLGISLGVSLIIMFIYLIIDFEFVNLFYNKYQITLLTGLITVVLGSLMTGSSNSSRGMYISKKLNKIDQDEKIAENSPDNHLKFTILGLLSSGGIQIIFGILIGKVGN